MSSRWGLDFVERVVDFSARVSACRRMLARLEEDGLLSKSKADAPYNAAIIRLILSTPGDMERYLEGRRIGFRNFERKKNGSLAKCEAYWLEDGEVP